MSMRPSLDYSFYRIPVSRANVTVTRQSPKVTRPAPLHNSERLDRPVTPAAATSRYLPRPTTLEIQQNEVCDSRKNDGRSVAGLLVEAPVAIEGFSQLKSRF
jgi:hypothetical protein